MLILFLIFAVAALITKLDESCARVLLAPSEGLSAGELVYNIVLSVLCVIGIAMVGLISDLMLNGQLMMWLLVDGFDQSAAQIGGVL